MKTRDTPKNQPENGSHGLAVFPIINDMILVNSQAKTADLVWTRGEWEAIARFLQNENGSTHFIMAWRKEGRANYSKSRKVTLDRAISWAWRTITAEVGADKRTTFVPYSQNSEGLSRWGCLDFDAHDGNHARAQQLAFSAWQVLLNGDLTIIIEATGGGWHVWCIAKEFRPVRDWTLFLRGVAKAIKATVGPGICEVFPDDTGARFGKGVRAPGSWNPATDALNAIFWENTGPLLKSLRSPIGKAAKSAEERLPNTKSNIYGKPDLYPAWNLHWKDQFLINQKSTRHKKLLGLVGECFHQVGNATAHKIVEAQYRDATVSMHASLRKHIEEFQAMWDGMLTTWISTLNPAEHAAYARLKTDNERDGFRIAKSFHRKSDQDGRNDFYIARNNFAARLSVSPPGAGHIRDRLVAAGVVELTAHYIQYRTATRYRWTLLTDDSAKLSKGAL